METIALKQHEFEYAYSNYRPKMSKLAYYKIGNIFDAEDICQELFLKLYENIDKIKNKKNWLNVVLRNMIASYYHNIRETPTLLDIFELDNNVCNSIFNNNYDNIETSILLDEILDNKEIFKCDINKKILYFLIFEDKSYMEIARLLNLTKKQIHPT